MKARYRFILVEKANFAVCRLCDVMKVSRSGFYDWCAREPSRRTTENELLLKEIRGIFENSYRRYGYRRVTRALRAQGTDVGRHRVARLMRGAGLVARRGRKFRVTTDSRHHHPVAKNVLNRQFEPVAHDQAWAGDITYIWTTEGWLYLAVLLDLYSRRVIGWAMGERINQELTLSALNMALGQRQPAPGFIHHTDRGSQYAATIYQQTLTQAGAISSMSRKGNCWDNAPSESFFSTLKMEEVYGRRFRTRDEARRVILRYLVWYNAHRLHSSLDYVSPLQFESLPLTQEKAA